jgi:hypothetical protein
MFGIVVVVPENRKAAFQTMNTVKVAVGSGALALGDGDG